VDRIISEVADRAKKHAPPGKLWRSKEDSRVRPTHVHAHGQVVPGNLRFSVPSMQWDMEHRGLGPATFMRYPKDESSRAVVNIVNCRCVADDLPDHVKDMIRAEKARLEGARVHGKVIAEGPFVVQAEYGDVYPLGLVADGAFFMTRAAAEAQAR
ncbi:MAG TPA: hypothetical protein VFP72_15430, partial [Kineosporiaceae bacterium]|nr:hypothetical protein [Kineosporiaceae bacterium]